VSNIEDLVFDFIRISRKERRGIWFSVRIQDTRRTRVDVYYTPSRGQYQDRTATKVSRDNMKEIQTYNASSESSNRSREQHKVRKNTYTPRTR
jgi:hypothetical protein